MWGKVPAAFAAARPWPAVSQRDGGLSGALIGRKSH
jgi:hypothetical protein